eukprot:917233_1
MAQFAICYKRYSTSQTLRDANCAIKTSDNLHFRTPYKYFYEIDLAAREMQSAGTLFTVTLIIDTILVIFALLTMHYGVFKTKHNLYVDEHKDITECTLLSMVCILIINVILNGVLAGMSGIRYRTGTDQLPKFKKMDCFRYDDTDFIHQMVQDSKQLEIIFVLALVTPFIALSPVILWVLLQVIMQDDDGPRRPRVPRKIFLRYLGGATVLMILHVIASIYLAYWYMVFQITPYFHMIGKLY